MDLLTGGLNSDRTARLIYPVNNLHRPIVVAWKSGLVLGLDAEELTRTGDLSGYEGVVLEGMMTRSEQKVRRRIRTRSSAYSVHDQLLQLCRLT